MLHNAKGQFKRKNPLLTTEKFTLLLLSMVATAHKIQFWLRQEKFEKAGLFLRLGHTDPAKTGIQFRQEPITRSLQL